MVKASLIKQLSSLQTDSGDVVARRRALLGWFSRVKNWFRRIWKEIKCGVVATVGVGPYLVAYNYFRFANAFKYDRLNDDQKFFIEPVHGPVRGIGVIYDAHFPPGWQRNVRPFSVDILDILRLQQT